MATKKELEQRIKRLEIQLELSHTAGGHLFRQINTPTLKGKIDAIVEHLGVEFTYIPRKEASIKAVKKGKSED